MHPACGGRSRSELEALPPHRRPQVHLGIGGGSLTVPFLTFYSVGIRNAVATSAACGFVLASIGAIGYLLTNTSQLPVPAAATGFVYWPAFFGIVIASIAVAPIGAWTAHTLPTHRLKQIFALFLGANGIRMLLG